MDQPTINNSTPQGGPNSFEMPPNVAPPEPMGQKPGEQNPVSQPPVSAPTSAPEQMPGPPHKPALSYVMIVILVIILILGTLLFASWRGWIGSQPKSSPTASTSPKISPAISSVLPTASPEASSSSVTTTNVNDETRKKDLANIKSALKKYYAVKAEYPASDSVIKTSDANSVLAQAIVPTYLQSLPNDPLAPNFYYGYKSDGQTFEITTVLEDKSDSSGTMTGNLNIYKVTDSSTE
ncbi:MAG: hypothetical protein US31_C0006G0007 [Berkelbacteria bacterium GW2011_GWA1_36_9]|uniref:Type II secretion system protein GspG C-terminal domain-containing protein n=1 Tax=Berkelbacteria bacterium GW2011_GWA1_36_9 TaxID=1618331 RepID=A0A0G0IQI5_9BACT|nr:MAG: hypothetical protein US31_C0006G0007 [Berkelbacteria bacterium GW2011_GWA1_36_9]